MALTILAIDDEEGWTRAASRWNWIRRNRFLRCNNGREGVTLAEAELPDLVLLNRKLYDKPGATPGSERVTHGLAALRAISRISEARDTEMETVIVSDERPPDVATEAEFWKLASRLIAKPLPPPAQLAVELEALLRYSSSLKVVSMGLVLSEPEEDLLRRLFYRQEEIRVFPFTEGFSGARLLRVDSSKGQSNIQSTQVVKMSPNKKEISREVVNYQNYVNGVIPLGKYAEIDLMIGLRKNREVAGFVLNLLDCDVEKVTDFQTAFKRLNSRDINARVEEILKLCLSKWHMTKTLQPSNLVVDRYSELKIVDLARVEAATTRILGFESVSDTITIDGFELTHPTDLVRKLKFRAVGPYYQCVSHGDLRGQNILVPLRGSGAWLIDFAKTRYRPLLYDFASLETSVKLEILAGVPWREFGRLELFLLRQRRLDERLGIPGSLGKTATKAAVTILKIRNLAYQANAQLECQTEYLHCLFLMALRFLQFEGEVADRRIRALLSANLISRRLNEK